MIEIAPTITLDEEELSFTTSRSSGPGGQNVNKVETRVTLRFDLEASPNLSPEAKALVRERLATRISKLGILSVSAQRERSQAANRDAARERFLELLRDALSTDPERRPTRTPRKVVRRRLDAKRRRGQLKRERSGPGNTDDQP